ncbi:hypothetical protein ABFV05_015703 [Capra hircus]
MEIKNSVRDKVIDGTCSVCFLLQNHKSYNERTFWNSVVMVCRLQFKVKQLRLQQGRGVSPRLQFRRRVRPGTSLEQQQGRGRQRRAEGATGVKEAKRQEMAQPVQEHTVPGAAFLLKDLRPPDERRPGALLTPLRLHESSLKGVKQRRPCAELGFGKGTRDSAAVAQGTRDSAAVAQGTQDTAAVAQGTRDSAAVAQGARDSAAAAQGTRDSAAAAQGTRDSAAVAQGARDSAAVAQGARDSVAAAQGLVAVVLKL